MKMIPRKTHGYLDYIVGFVLIAAPWLFGFANGGNETWVFVALGAVTILYSFFTDYELGVVKAIPFKAHLGIDMLNGGFLALSPWILGFSELVFLPHLLFGLMELAVVLLTSATDTHAKTGIRMKLSTH
jgi:hypothetical protein